MTGPEHWREAEEHLAFAAGIETDGDQDGMSAWHQRQAQVHAMLAHVAATALPGEHAGDWRREIWAFGPAGTTDEPGPDDFDPGPYERGQS